MSVVDTNNILLQSEPQLSVTPALTFADGAPVALDDVILNEDVTFECQVRNNIGLTVTHYLWDVTAESGGSAWSCGDTTSSSTMTCTVSNDCTMNVECTPYSDSTAGNPGSIDVTVQGCLAYMMSKVAVVHSE